MPARSQFQASGLSDSFGIAALTRDSLELPPAIAAAMIDHLRACLPAEGVGLISVLDDPSSWIADRYYPGRNADSSPTRFTMNPVDVGFALSEMKRRGSRLGAIVHSHPRTPPEPSALDLAEATASGVFHVIVGFTPRVTVKAWRLTFDRAGRAVDAVEAPLRLVASVTG